MPAKAPIFINNQVSIRVLDGVTNYIANDFETNTLIASDYICEILPFNIDSVSESPSFNLELEREKLMYFDSSDRKHILSSKKYDTEQVMYEGRDLLEDDEDL